MYYFNIIEENELSFVELFSRKIIVSEYVTLYYNSVMRDDEFFNRIVVKDCNAIVDVVNAEEILKSKGVTPFIYSTHKSRLMEEYGYSVYDMIITLVNNNNDRISVVYSNNNSNVTIDKGIKDERYVDMWIDIFSNAFNINHYKREIRKRIAEALKLHGNKLILNLAYSKSNYYNSKPIGCSALFLSSNVMGLYCLGVLQEYRRQGVASLLIREAVLEARSKSLILVVQTFARDNLTSFYSKHGFVYAYSKFIYCK